MGNPVNLLDRMAAAGVSFPDAHWYHTVARPRKFSGPNDARRAQAILRKIARSKH